MRDALGGAYTTALRKTYAGHVPESADLVMFWWYRAAAIVQAGQAERFGFITTNSLKQTFNRRVLQPFLEGEAAPLQLAFAVPDHPWVEGGDGAAVRVALTVAEPKPVGATATGQLLKVRSETIPQGDNAADVLFDNEQGSIRPDLSIGAALDEATPLRANEGLANRGVSLFGAGFIVDPNQARVLGLGQVQGLEKYIRHYRNGKDLAARPRGVMVIDLFGLTSVQVLTKFPEVYQHLFEQVKPERDKNNRPSRRDNWWLFGETNPKLRQMLAGLPRYIATVETSKHRLFQFLDATILPDNKLVAFALDNAFSLGVLSSRVHTVWALATGSFLGVGNDSVYAKSRCFDPFPFPTAPEAQQQKIRELAEQLDAHRKRQQAKYPTLMLTDLYNVVEKLRGSQTLTVKEEVTHQQGLVGVVVSLHQQLDEAVATAYGWPATLNDADILTHLVQLNQQRTAEEEAGTVRYLRPKYQAPDQQQAALSLPTTTTTATLATTTEAQPWPAELAQQMLAVRAIVQQAAGAALSSAQVAARFRRTKADKVKPLLDTLAMMSQVRHLEPEDTYAA